MNLWNLHNNPAKVAKFDCRLLVPEVAYSTIYNTEINQLDAGIIRKTVSKSPIYAYKFAQFILKDRFPMGEDAISKNAHYALLYAMNIIDGTFPMGETAIATNAEYSYKYAKQILKGKRFPEAERNMESSPEFAFSYARDILKGRFPEAEEAILNSRYKYCYQELTETLYSPITN